MHAGVLSFRVGESEEQVEHHHPLRPDGGRVRRDESLACNGLYMKTCLMDNNNSLRYSSTWTSYANLASAL